MIVDIQTISQIHSDKYGNCLLVECFPIIDSPLGWGGCIDMTRTVQLLYPDTPKMMAYLRDAKNNKEEYFEFHEEAVFEQEYVSEIGTCYVHNSFNDTHPFSKNVGLAVDLGLSVLWSNMNVGASNPSDYGTLFGYGDPTGEKLSDEESDYPQVDICGTKYDIAKANWGGNWRMPTAQELEELVENCFFVERSINGVKGCAVIGPNGNSIFLPFAGSRKQVSIYRLGEMGECWAGTLSKFGSPVNMMFYGSKAFLNWGASGYWGSSVRPVIEE